MASHTYWRVFITALNGGTVPAIEELQFYDSGGNLLSSGGTPSAKDHYDGATYDESKAFDANFSTFWNGNTGVDSWLAYQFSSAVEPAVVRMVGRESLITQTPATFKFQYSDDGSSWSDATGPLTPDWTPAVGWSFPISTPADGSYVNWRIKINHTGADASASLADLQFRVSVGGAQQADATPQYAAADTVFTGYPAHQAFDASTATFWSAFNGLPGTWWIKHSFKSALRIIEVVLTARNDSSGTTQTAIDFDLQGSNDGASWTTVQNFTTSNDWTAGESRTFLSSGIYPSGIESAEAFGTAAITANFILPDGIASAEAFGTAALTHKMYPVGIASAEAFGTAFVGLPIYPSGIASAEAFGTPAVTRGLSLSGWGIASDEAFGVPTLVPVTARGIVVYIAGVDRTAWVEIGIRRQITMSGGSKATCSFVVNNKKLALFRPEAGDEVVIYEGATRFFAGVVDRTSEVDYSGTVGLCKIAVDCVDYGALCDRRILHRHLEVWEGGIAVVTVAVIAREKLADLGVVFTQTIADPGVNLGVQNFNGVTVTQAFNQVCSAVNLDWHIDFYGNLYLASKTHGYGPAPFSLAQNDGQWSEMIVQRSAGRYANKVGVRNSQDLNTLWKDEYTTDGTTQMWIPNAELKAKPTILVDGTEAVVTDFMDYAGEWDFYWLPFSIVWNPAHALTTGQTIELYYPSQLSYIAWAQDDAEIAAHGLWEAVEEVKDIEDVATLEATAAAVLAKRKARAASVQFRTDVAGLEPGQLLSVNLARPLLADDLLITDVSSEELSKSFGFRHQVSASNAQSESVDSVIAYYQKVAAQLRQARDRVIERIGFTLAETIDGEDNPGLSTGVKRAVRVASKSGYARVCSLYFNSASATTGTVEIDMLKNGVSIFGSRKMEWPAGASTVQYNYVFSSFPDPLAVAEGDVFTVAVLQADVNAKDGTIELVVTG